MFGIQRIKNNVKERIDKSKEEGGLMVQFAYPILFTFTATFIVARLFSYFVPDLFIQVNGVHFHHFAFGIIILAIVGYLGLYLKDDEEKFWLSLLYGFGLGLAFDEFGMWLNLDDSDPVRWEYDGFTVIIAVLLLIIFAKPGWRLIKKIFKKENKEESINSQKTN